MKEGEATRQTEKVRERKEEGRREEGVVRRGPRNQKDPDRDQVARISPPTPCGSGRVDAELLDLRNNKLIDHV